MEQDLNTNNFLKRFNSFVEEINEVDWKRSLAEDYKLYNIKQYNVEKLSTRRAKELYNNLVTKFYEDEKESEAWHENELRLFVWCLIAYSHLVRKSLAEFKEAEWINISKLFYGKNPTLCQFQYLSLKKTPVKNERWSAEEDQHLIDVIISKAQKNKWNEIAKDIFYRSNRRFFRSAKQCRERWNNYLVPQKTRGAWEPEEDLILINCVRREGKKWAFIAKNLQDRRTEHMVKNRYKSLVTRFKKELKNKRFRSEKDLLNALYAQMQVKKIVQTQPEEEEVELENELSAELRLPQEPVKAIQSCTQITDVPMDAETPRLIETPERQVGFATWDELCEFHRRRSFSIQDDFIDFGVGLMSDDSVHF